MPSVGFPSKPWITIQRKVEDEFSVILRLQFSGILADIGATGIMAHAANNTGAFDTENPRPSQICAKFDMDHRAAGSCRKADVLLRCLCFVCTLAACAIMATDRQTVIFFGVQMTAAYRYTPASVYFVIANGICCGYLFVSLGLSVKELLKHSDSPSSTRRLVFLLDVIMFGLVLSAASSASTVAYIGFKGDSHVGWTATCGVMGKYCHKGMGAAAGSFLAVVLFLPLIVFPVYGSIN